MTIEIRNQIRLSETTNRFQCQIEHTHRRSHHMHAGQRQHITKAMTMLEWSAARALDQTVKCHHKSMAGDDKKPYAVPNATSRIGAKGKNPKHLCCEMALQRAGVRAVVHMAADFNCV